MAEAYKRNPNTNCSICKKEIYRRPSEIAANKGRVFCSPACYGISLRKEIPCSMCGKLILTGLNKKTCSRSCANKYRTGIKYKIGRPSKSKVKSQQLLKLRLLKVRGKKCEKCDYDKYEILQVHHKNRDRNNNELKNLELICPNCHYEEHFLKNSWLKNKLEKKPEIAILN
ncbi:MAG: HNH endonuclease signature motif containing protein [Candidatus Pacebacteria bacterium]|nr:HNH endonuclease signature motif containing protein [Candidatus Paceibacterota bacterium]